MSKCEQPQCPGGPYVMCTNPACDNHIHVDEPRAQPYYYHCIPCVYEMNGKGAQK